MLSAVLLLALAAAPAEADGERFKAFFNKGEELFSDGEYGAAIWNFRQADALRRTPEVAYDLGKCHEKLGDKAYATYYYRLYLRRAPSAPDTLDVAEHVGEALAEAEHEGRGLLEVESVAAGKAVLNGVSYAEFPIAVFLPPGDYELSANFAGAVRKRTVSMRTGKVTTIDFEPVPPPLLSDATQGPPDFAPSAEVAKKSFKRYPGLRLPSYVTLGASAAALAAGTLLGAMASADEARLKSERSSLTVTQARGLADGANGKGGAANFLWVAGGAGAVAGGVMFVLSMPEPGGKK